MPAVSANRLPPAPPPVLLFDRVAKSSGRLRSELPVGDSVLMGSDCCSAMGPPPTVGNNFAIAIEGESRKHCDAIFAQLSEGGTVRMPLDDMFWGAYYGMWTDRFGINWLINYLFDTIISKHPYKPLIHID